MELGLKYETVMVVGGSRGLGKEIARAFVREGATVIICGRDRKTLLETCAELRGECEEGLVEIADLDATRHEEVKVPFHTLESTHRLLRVLVNNVGGPIRFGTYSGGANGDPINAELWENAWRLNFESTRLCCEEALPLLKKNDNASIINICSLPAHQPGDHNPHYSAAKAAQLNYSKAISRAWGKYGIRVNTVCPGSLMGGAWEANIQARATREGVSFEEAKRRIMETDTAKLSLAYVGTLEDVANLVVFLASDKARYITGQCIDVDGGACRSIS